MAVNKQKILITTYHFYPENTPRAFRAFELAKEFSKRGYSIKVYTADIGSDYADLEQKYNFKVSTYKKHFRDRTQFVKQRSQIVVPDENNENAGWSNLFKKWLVLLKYRLGRGMEYFFYRSRLFSVFSLFLALRKESERFDLLISIGLPFSVHLGTGLALKMDNKFAGVTIADYGDPFSNSPFFNNAGYFKFIERFILKSFNYVTVPISRSMKAFIDLTNPEKLKVIPQGFDFFATPVAIYKKNRVPTFSYAGCFYKKLRNPEVLLCFLSRLDFDFKFILIIDTKDSDTMECVLPFKGKLADKLEIRDLVPRAQCINELSKMDFLVNQYNLSATQTPSKLIDYALTGRPIFSFSQESLDTEKLLAFLRGDYSKSDTINVDNYNIINVANQFLDLADLNEGRAK